MGIMDLAQSPISIPIITIVQLSNYNNLIKKYLIIFYIFKILKIKILGIGPNT